MIEFKISIVFVNALILLKYLFYYVEIENNSGEERENSFGLETIYKLANPIN